MKLRMLPVLMLWAFMGALSAQAAPVDLGVVDQVKVFENRFFFHEYDKDPVEKRLQRLELLVYGETRGGSNEQRLAELKKTVADRDKQSALKTQQSAQEPGARPPAIKPPSTSSQYPVLSTLEWRAFKKTYPDGSLDDRLGRLETSIFGQPSSAMAYADRVERLKKTLGLGVTANRVPLMLGPKSRALPRDLEQESPFSFGWNQTIPFGGFSPPDSQASETLRRLNEQMNQQLAEMQEMMKSAPKGNHFFFQIKPGAPPSMMQPSPSRPFGGGKPQAEVPPPYNDPNSI